ncbi:MAG: ATP-binding protein [Pseudomonadota bacterium]|uniref:hybrid sensor histidine kinase/response regulator n=1 Tax=Phenylobacterium sp. TaxID=1871053 RepID=UPI0025FD5A8F|nr:ATP-binding protein [Phenylobacterium sp.]MBT9472818.1 response regulator [Phenylobacterium sp.]
MARTNRSHNLMLSGGLVLAFVACVLFSLTLTRGSEGVAVIWLASGILAAAFLLLPWRWSLGMVVICFSFNFGYNLVVGNSPIASFIFPVLTFSEAFGAAWLARRTCGATVRLTSFNRVARLLLLAVAPATAASALAAADIFTIYGRNFDSVLTSWFYGHALGMAIMLPAVLLIARPEMVRDFRRSPWEEIGLYALIAAVSTLIFLPVRFPMPLLIFPALALLSFRLGPRGAAVSALIMAAILSSLVIVVSTPPNQATWTLAEKTRGLQFLIAVGFFTSLATAMAIANQKRMKRLWASRSRIARLAQARAVAAGLAKTEFLATMSHEIRTPMTSIVGFTEVLLKREDLPDPARRQLALIDRAGASLLTVVNDILDFSKVEAGEVELRPNQALPRAIAQDALAIVTEAARRKDIDLQLSFIGPVESPVLIDDLRVRQILLNLLSNAIKFTERGRVGLELQVFEQGDGAHLLRFKISDTGIGIPSDQVERLFKRFSQGDSSVSRTHGGTGLGLAICKGLTDLMGGKIGVTSTLGAGSTFWFELIAPRAQTGAAAKPARPDDGPLKARILLVDDHPMNRELGATVLGLLGCEVVLAENGEEGVAAAKIGDCDLILMDVHMPRMDGLEATRAIRALGGVNAVVPIIAMSADVMPEMEAACLKAGMNAAVGKPIQIQALHDVLAKWLSPDRNAAAA